MEKESSINRSSLNRSSFNYLFFGSYFFIVALIHIFHVFLIEPEVTFSSCFFMVFAFAQSLLETTALILLGNLIRQFLPYFCYRLFIIAAFTLLLSHIIDFPLVRLMGMSFWFALHFVFQESYSNFIELLLASSVSLFIWAVAGLAAIGVILSGLFLYWITEKWTDRRPCYVTYPVLVAILGTTALFLLIWEASTVKHTAANHFETYAQTLPFKTTLIPQGKEYLALGNSLQGPEEEQAAACRLDTYSFALTHKPDIYLFIVESLREDYITPQIAPELHRFKSDNISFDLALSNANATQNSWFSIFYSKFPFYFGKIQPDNWQGGSIPLRLLKKMGYTIHVYSSARLGYYEMDHLILGESRQLADSYYSFDDSDIHETYQKDESAIENLIEHMHRGEGGRVFLVFLDSTHHDYSWPSETASHFHPFEDKINYLKAAVSNEGLEGIRNRYRNSLRYVDSLFGRFFQAMNSYKGGKEAVVIVTGDHAEEFYEQGHLFHASGLSIQQTHIPLYFKFGQNERTVSPDRLSCHMDIFPSVLHYVLGEETLTDVLQGLSIFSTKTWPYIVTARFNASRSPYEFFIHNGTERMTARFTNETNIFKAKHLQILSIKNQQDETIPFDLELIKDRFGAAIDRIFSP